MQDQVSQAGKDEHPALDIVKNEAPAALFSDFHRASPLMKKTHITQVTLTGLFTLKLNCPVELSRPMTAQLSPFIYEHVIV